MSITGTDGETRQSLLSINRLLYIGPWHHIELTSNYNLQHVKEFIYIDTQPRSEDDEPFKFDRRFYRDNFMKNMRQKCKELNFTLIKMKTLDANYHEKLNLGIFEKIFYKTLYPDINPCLYVFKNNTTGVMLKYYISTNIKYNMTNELKNDITDSDALFVSGYYPDNEVLKYFNTPKSFIGATNTIYRDDEEDSKDTIIEYMLSKDTAKFDKIYMCAYHSQHMKLCDSFADMIDKCHKHPHEFAEGVEEV